MSKKSPSRACERIEFEKRNTGIQQLDMLALQGLALRGLEVRELVDDYPSDEANVGAATVLYTRRRRRAGHA